MSRMEYGFIAQFQENDDRIIIATDGSRPYWELYGEQTNIVRWSG